MELKATIMLLALLGAGVNANAPDDQQFQCTKRTLPFDPGHGLVGAYTRRQKPLLDSYWYGRLVGSTGVWDFIQGNEGRNGWRRGQIALCRNTIVSRHSSNPAEDNWFSTQFISRSTAQATYDLPITVKVSHSFLSCVPKRFRLHYYPSASDPGSSSGTANYIHIGDVNTNTNTLQTSTFTFNLGSQYGGFYLGFQDQDSCSIIQRVQVYYGICPSRTEGLVTYPETPTGTSAVPMTHQCAANAEVSGGGLMCNTDGSWSGSPSCSCAAGHILNEGNCQACPAGTYQSGSSCLSCPANTVRTSVGVAACSCKDNYYRAPSDSPSNSCTVPPSKVQNLQAPDDGLTNTSIRIQWTAPATTGGRSDLVYQISYRKIGTEDANMRTTTQTSYQLTGLQPLSEYKITVVSANGITKGLPDVEAVTLKSRTAKIPASTTEGVPCPPASVAVVDRAVIWQPPKCPNGNLLGYHIRVYSAGNIGQAQIINNVDVNSMHHKLFSIPDGNDLRVQVRGRTAVGAGEWSTPRPLSRSAFETCPEPSTVTVTVTDTPSPVPAPVPSCSVAEITNIITVTATKTEIIVEPRTVVVTETLTPTPIACPSPLPIINPSPIPEPVRLIREEITTSVGNIKTPSHPSLAYPNNADYFWTINIPDAGKAVELTFHGTFDIEYTRNCSGSYLEVRDGDSPDSVLVGKYCGSALPSSISSSTNFLYIHFHSSSSQTTNTGFNATFKSVETVKSRRCGALITSSKFSSGGFPAAYTGNTPRTCTYLVANLQTFSHTDLRFLFTDLKNCTQGMIEVYTHVGNVATICNAEDAKNALSVPDFLFNIRYTIKVPGLRGFSVVLNDKCKNGKELSRNGDCI